MKAMRFTPKGYGGNRRDPDQVKRDGWHDEGLLAVSVNDHAAQSGASGSTCGCACRDG